MRYRKQTKTEAWQSTKVKAFYKGNQYFLFVTERFEDIRFSWCSAFKYWEIWKRYRQLGIP